MPWCLSFLMSSQTSPPTSLTPAKHTHIRHVLGFVWSLNNAFLHFKECIYFSYRISLSINKLPFHFTVLPLIVLSRYTRVSYDHSHCDFSGVSIWWIWWLHLHHTRRLQGRPKPFSWSLTDTEDDAIQPRKARECRDPRVNPNRRDKCFRGKGNYVDLTHQWYNEMGLQ